MKRITVLLILVGALMLPGSALASGSSSTCQGYSSQTAGVVGSNTGANGGACNSAVEAVSATTSTVAQGSLPFTGMDVALLVIGGGVLLGAGLLVRRFANPTE